VAGDVEALCSKREGEPILAEWRSCARKRNMSERDTISSLLGAAGKGVGKRNKGKDIQ
jgi:hypothetical protein